ncbi:MAG: hypothetical protein ABSG65_07235 [Bryobacteraceae bacterium]
MFPERERLSAEIVLELRRMVTDAMIALYAGIIDPFAMYTPQQLGGVKAAKDEKGNKLPAVRGILPGIGYDEVLEEIVDSRRYGFAVSCKKNRTRRTGFEIPGWVVILYLDEHRPRRVAA